MRAQLGFVRAEQTVTITAGRLFAVDIPLNAARLQLTTAGGLQAPTFSAFEDDPDAAGGRREVARSAAQPAEFALPPGTYYAVARQGAVEARERLAVGPGELVRRTLAVAAGSLALSTKLPPLGGAADSHISYTVTRLDSTAQDAITTSQPAPTLLLPSGRYRVEGRYGLMNVKAVRDIEIKAGDKSSNSSSSTKLPPSDCALSARAHRTFPGSSGTRRARPFGPVRTQKRSPTWRPDATWSGQRPATSATNAAWNYAPGRPSCWNSRSIDGRMALNPLMSLANSGVRFAEAGNS